MGAPKAGNIVQVAQKEIKALEERVALLCQFIHDYEQIAVDYKLVDKKGHTFRTDGLLKKTEDLAIQIICEHGGCVPTRVIYNKLMELGFDPGGYRGVATLSARLSRSAKLENFKPFGWRVRSQLHGQDKNTIVYPDHADCLPPPKDPADAGA